jgi:hypothetical protein
MAQDNPTWGAPRIHGELLKMDYLVRTGHQSGKAGHQIERVEDDVGGAVAPAVAEAARPLDLTGPSSGAEPRPKRLEHATREARARTGSR